MAGLSLEDLEMRDVRSSEFFHIEDDHLTVADDGGRGREGRLSFERGEQSFRYQHCDSRRPSPVWCWKPQRLFVCCICSKSMLVPKKVMGACGFAFK